MAAPAAPETAAQTAITAPIAPIPSAIELHAPERALLLGNNFDIKLKMSASGNPEIVVSQNTKNRDKTLHTRAVMTTGLTFAANLTDGTTPIPKFANMCQRIDRAGKTAAIVEYDDMNALTGIGSIMRSVFPGCHCIGIVGGITLTYGPDTLVRTSKDRTSPLGRTHVAQFLVVVVRNNVKRFDQEGNEIPSRFPTDRLSVAFLQMLPGENGKYQCRVPADRNGHTSTLVIGTTSHHAEDRKEFMLSLKTLLNWYINTTSAVRREMALRARAIRPAAAAAATSDIEEINGGITEAAEDPQQPSVQLMDSDDEQDSKGDDTDGPRFEEIDAPQQPAMKPEELQLIVVPNQPIVPGKVATEEHRDIAGIAEATQA